MKLNLNRAEIGDRIKAEILKSGKSQNAIAKEAEIGKDTMSGMVNGSQFTLDSLVAVADALGGVSIDYLLGRDECKTHDAQSIHELTGLTDEAINVLIETQKEIKGQIEYYRSLAPNDEKADEIQYRIEDSPVMMALFTHQYFPLVASAIIENETLIKEIKGYSMYFDKSKDIVHKGILAENDHYDELIEMAESKNKRENGIAKSMLEKIEHEETLFTNSIQEGMKAIMADRVMEIIDEILEYNFF